MRAWLTRCTVLTTLALIACGTVAPTPSPTLPPIPTPRPTATLTSLQATADMVRRNQQVQQVIVAQATATAACDNLRATYTRNNQVFDQALTTTDPERVMVELRLMHGGNGRPHTFGPMESVELSWRIWVNRCGGR